MTSTTSNRIANNYCIPVALSLLLDIPIQDVETSLRKRLGNQELARGYYYPIAIRVLREHGLEVKEKILANEWRTTVGKLVGLLKHLPHSDYRRWLILVRGHAMVYINGELKDNGQASRYFNREVEELFEVSK